MKGQKDMLNIMSLILEVSSDNNDDTKKKITTTKIMYNTLLDHPRLKDYWSALTELAYLSTRSLLRHLRLLKKVIDSLKSLAN